MSRADGAEEEADEARRSSEIYKPGEPLENRWRIAGEPVDQKPTDQPKGEEKKTENWARVESQRGTGSEERVGKQEEQFSVKEGEEDVCREGKSVRRRSEEHLVFITLVFFSLR